MRRVLVLAIPVVVLCCGICLLQAHSLTFWRDAIGDWTGYAWSVQLEAISLWLWFRADGWGSPWRWIAVVTTLLLLVGPLYQVSSPLFVQGARSAAFEKEMARVDGLSATFQANSRARVGWAGRLDDAEAYRRMLFARRWGGSSGEPETQTPLRSDWQRHLIIALQIVSILVFQPCIILAITTVSAHFRQVANSGDNTASDTETAALPAQTPDANEPISTVPAPSSAKADANPTDELVLRLQRIVKMQLGQGRGYAEIVEATGIQKPYLSLLMNHFDRSARGDRTLGVEALRRMETMFQKGSRPAVPQSASSPAA